MQSYKCITNQAFLNENGFTLVPIREVDKYDILKMRNEQIYHLRQSELLTAEQQEHYFKSVISELFEKDKPEQLLFSLLKNNEFIGYGGLVHMNWINKNSEISFIMKTELEKEHFEHNWLNYLSLIEKIAFDELRFHKIFTYAFDLRPHLYKALENAGYIQEARLKEHCLFETKYIDVVIHSKFNVQC